MRRVLVGILAIGCGNSNTPTDAADPAADPDDGLRSGTRIKLQWDDFGGTRALRGAFDLARNEACTPRAWDDGKTYCTPVASSIAYLDAQCQQPVARVNVDATSCMPDPVPPAYARDDSDACSLMASHLYGRGTKLAPAAYYDLDADGTCVGPRNSPNVALYELGPEIARTALAEVTLDRSQGAGRLARQTSSTVDGARVASGLYDTSLGAACRMTRVATARGACVPEPASFSRRFRDAACSQSVFVGTAGCPAPRFGAIAAMPPQCSEAAYVALEQPVMSSPLYDGSPEACSATTASATETFYGAGALVALAELPRTIDAEADRTVQLAHYGAGAVRARDFVLQDHGHDSECFPRTLGDGTTRCIPFNVGVAQLYADAACTQPIEVGRTPDSCGTVPPPRFANRFITPVPGACAGLEIYALGPPYTAPLYQRLSTCIPASPASYFQLGTRQPLEEFPLATLVTDP